MSTPSRYDSNTPGGDHVAPFGHALRLLGRATRLRCPNCGRGPVLVHWLKLRERCGRCEIRFERGEHDHFIGSLLLNYSLTGALVVVAILVILATHAEVPWTLLQWALPAAVVVLPVVLYPFSKLLWLAVDLIFRPEQPHEP